MKHFQVHCSSVKQQIFNYLDHRCSPVLAAEIETHFAECLSCKKEFEEQKKIWTTLAAFSAPEPHIRLELAVLRRIDQEEKQPFTRRLFPVPMGAAALGLAVGVFMASGVIEHNESLIASAHEISHVLDVFSPSPQGSFSNAYFAMTNETGW